MARRFHRLLFTGFAIPLAIGAVACGMATKPTGEKPDAGRDAGVDAGEQDAGPPDAGICVPGPLDAGVAEWSQRCPIVAPSSRYAPAMAYDSQREVTVLFGGNDGNVQPFGDTWQWDGQNWTQLFPGTSPPGRSNSAMDFDSNQGVTVLCGGLEWDTYVLDDTWQWDGTNWTQMMPVTNPPGRFYNAMAYDSAHQVSVMFGGEQWYTGELLGDTWLWDGNDWTQVATTGSAPTPRILHAMDYDSTRNVTVLFGGVSGSEDTSWTYDNDTWEWDGTSWTQRTPTVSPPGRDMLMMAYDPARQATLLFAGFSQTSGQVVYDDTWAWDGTNWAELFPPVSPSGRDDSAMAFDSTHGMAVLFGGCPSKACLRSAPDLLGDTWEWLDGP